MRSRIRQDAGSELRSPAQTEAIRTDPSVLKNHIRHIRPHHSRRRPPPPQDETR